MACGHYREGRGALHQPIRPRRIAVGGRRARGPAHAHHRAREPDAPEVTIDNPLCPWGEHARQHFHARAGGHPVATGLQNTPIGVTRSCAFADDDKKAAPYPARRPRGGSRPPRKGGGEGLWRGSRSSVLAGSPLVLQQETPLPHLRYIPCSLSPTFPTSI